MNYALSVLAALTATVLAINEVDHSAERIVQPLELPPVESKAPPIMTAEGLVNELKRVYRLSDKRARLFAPWILMASDQSGVPSTLLSSLIMTESSFRIHAISSVGAIGPAQIRPRFWADTCAFLGDLTDPAVNIACAAEILIQYRNRCDGDWYCALAFYNVGPSGYRYSKRGRSAGDRYISRVTTFLSLHTSGMPMSSDF